ncbi:MAG: hypothetical protein HQM10_03705 [Candidatus Riflebacteria bacterium]|nr:hypothetical protein [Candidatus Riflebacteria bacterium]
MKNTSLLLLSFLFLVNFPIYSQISATTEKGDKVVLLENGTWKAASESQDIFSIASSTEIFDFRKAFWGFTPDEIKKTENTDIISESESMILYSDNVSGLKCLVAYIFTEGKLTRTKYIIDQIHTNKNDYISDYNLLKDLLSAKYGKARSNEFWKKSHLKSNPEHYGMAISCGELVYQSIWKTKNTEIFLTLEGDNFKISLEVQYSSIKLQSLEDKNQKNRDKDKL